MSTEAPQLVLSPSSILQFPPRSNNQPSTVLSLRNDSSKLVAFKIKTTEPKAYLVKPSSGVIGAASTVSINIIHVAHRSNGAHDRFLVQAVYTESDQPLSKEDWTAFQANKQLLFEQKLSVARPPESASGASGAPGASGAAGSASGAAGAGGSGSGAGGSASGAGAGVGARSVGASSLPQFVYQPTPENESDLRRSYQQLVSYAIALDKRRQELELEVDEFQRAATAKGGPTPKYDPAHPQGWQTWQVLALLFAVLLVHYGSRLLK